MHDSCLLIYNLTDAIESVLELQYTGKEYALREGIVYFQKLSDYFLVNYRLSYKINLTGGLQAERFGRVNNIFDRLYYSQRGTPEAGRTIQAGIAIVM
jgi:outer membrane receptor protein involved in Fe transport